MPTSDIQTANPAPLITLPAQLWVGAQSDTRYEIATQLKQHFCANGGCNSCSTCSAIDQEQHHSIIWIRPETSYTRDMLAPIFEQLSFAMDPNHHFFFVLEDIDFMPSASANSLLKSLEEPPYGYHFLLTAQRMQSILPTIRSRCVIHTLAATMEEQKHALYEFFISDKFYDPSIFLKELETTKINERESVELLDQLLSHWMQSVKKSIKDGDSHAYRTANSGYQIIASAFKKLPMPGSSKLFWKELYLALKAIP